MPSSPFLIQIGPLAVRWYSVMILLGVLAATAVARREARRQHQDPAHIWGLLPGVLVLGLLGARLGWVLVSLHAVQARGWEHALFIWEGGISIQGALPGGLVAGLLYTRRKRLSFLTWADIIIPGVALAQAIGRWGNFFNQELFGAPCTQPWCLPISDAVLQRDPRYAAYVGQGTHFAPTFAYEMLWDLLNFGLLLGLGRQRRWCLRSGDLLWIYGLVYSIGRFFIEDIRLDSATVGGLKAPQIIALLTITLCSLILLWRHRPAGAVAGAPPAEDSPPAVPPAPPILRTGAGPGAAVPDGSGTAARSPALGDPTDPRTAAGSG